MFESLGLKAALSDDNKSPTIGQNKNETQTWIFHRPCKNDPKILYSSDFFLIVFWKSNIQFRFNLQLKILECDILIALTIDLI